MYRFYSRLWLLSGKRVIGTLQTSSKSRPWQLKGGASERYECAHVPAARGGVAFTYDHGNRLTLSVILGATHVYLQRSRIESEPHGNTTRPTVRPVHSQMMRSKIVAKPRSRLFWMALVAIVMSVGSTVVGAPLSVAIFFGIPAGAISFLLVGLYHEPVDDPPLRLQEEGRELASRDPNIITGVGMSVGTAQGRARVVRSLSKASKVQPGDAEVT